MKNCLNCRYSRDVGPYLACYGQKNAPEVAWDDVCEDWKPEHATNADRIRAMTDEDLAFFLDDVQKCNICCNPIICDDCADCMTDLCWQCWRDWLKQEAKE